MSDTWQGAGWWQASDGKWYPPETAPQGWQPPPQPTQPQPAWAPAQAPAPAPAPVPETAAVPDPGAPTATRARWEYHATIGSVMAGDTTFLDQLDGLGKDGWELVSIVPLEASQQAAFLKRERTD